MNQIMKFKQNRRSPDSLLILLLLCIFALSSFILVVFGANVYNDISQRRDSNFQHTTPLFYTASKVRSVENADAVRVETKDGTPALVLSVTDGGEPCETWIYTYENALCEIYISRGTAFALSDGAPILRDCRLDFSLEKDLLTLRSTDSSGRPMELSLALGGGRHE